MKKILLFTIILNTTNLIAQVPEDAVRYSWYVQNGSARNMAIGGSMGSLGGEISTVFFNPAGLAFYKNSEFVFTPGYIGNKNSINYRESENKNEKHAMSLGPTGFIVGIPNSRHPEKNSAFSVAFTQKTSFNNNINYTGLNNYSSFSEQFVEELIKSGLSIDAVMTSNSPLPYTVAPAWYTNLIDTVRINGVLQVKAAPEFLLDSKIALQQNMNRVTTGGIYEAAFSVAHKLNEQWLFGGTFGIPIINFHAINTFTEKDISGDTSNGFHAFTYTDNFTTSGTGINLKLGVIYRPKDYVRFGFAFHTPDMMMLTDKRTTSLTADLENPTESFSVSSTTFTNNQPGQSKYSLNTAWKAMFSGSYVFREEEDIRRQKGFITADLEYVKHKSSRFGPYNSTNANPTAAETSYYKTLNSVVKYNYKGAFNFRVGGELKFNVIMGRLGFAYYGNPYIDKAFNASRMILSGGLGYRNKGFFVDMTYAYQIKKDVDLPYRLSDRANTFANNRLNQGNIIATVGVKL